MDKETLKYVLTQSAMRPLPPATPRTLELPLDSNKIVALVGIRRSGKTFLLYETMRRLEARGVDRLLPIDVRELDLILRAHDELYPEFSGRRRYVFFDEVQGGRSTSTWCSTGTWSSAAAWATRS